MHLLRNIQRLLTFVPRAWHRHGFGVHSPHDYELVKDVLFEKMAYYAYDEQSLTRNKDRQMYRLKLHFGDNLIYAENDADGIYEQLASSVADGKVLVIENLSGKNYPLWKKILGDNRARVTFDMGNRGLVLFDKKRIKQNYLL